MFAGSSWREFAYSPAHQLIFFRRGRIKLLVGALSLKGWTIATSRSSQLALKSMPEILKSEFLHDCRLPNLLLDSVASPTALPGPHARVARPVASCTPLTRSFSSSGFSEPVADTLPVPAHRSEPDSMRTGTAPGVQRLSLGV